MSKIDLKNLTEDQRQELLADLKKDQESKALKKRQDRADYEDLKDMSIREAFELLRGASTALNEVKIAVFDHFDDVLALKQKIFDLTDEQMERQESHSFSSKDGKVTIIIGSNTVDSWDESVDVGVIKVKEYLKKLAIDEKTGNLVGYLTDMLKPDKDGALKASRVLDMSKKAHELGDNDLIEAVDLIREAYRPSRSSTYIKAKFKNDKNSYVYLPLSMSALP